MLAALAYPVAEWMVRRLPRRWSIALAVAGARLAFAAGVPARGFAEANLARLTGSPLMAADAARQAFEQCARGLVEFLALERMSAERLAAAVDVRGIEHLEAAAGSGRGVILLSAHLGNWEWGAAALAARGARIHLVARAQAHPRVESMFARRRLAFGITRLASRPLWAAAARLLRERSWLALMADRAEPGERHSVCAWAAALARRTGAVILPVLTVRTEEGRYTLVVEPAMSAEGCAAGEFRECLRRHLARNAGQWCAFAPLPEALA